MAVAIHFSLLRNKKLIQMHLCLAPGGATGPEVQKIASRLFLLLRNKKIYFYGRGQRTGHMAEKIASALLRPFFIASQ